MSFFNELFRYFVDVHFESTKSCGKFETFKKNSSIFQNVPLTWPTQLFSLKIDEHRQNAKNG